MIRDADAAESQASQEYVERETYPLLGDSVYPVIRGQYMVY